MTIQNICKSTVGIVVAVVVLGMTAMPAFAQGLTDLSADMSNQTQNEATDFEFNFTMDPSGSGIAINETIEIVFPAGFSGFASLANSDIDLVIDGAEQTVNTSAGGEWEFTVTGNALELTNSTTTAFGAGAVIEVEVGTNATFGAVGVNQITLPNTPSASNTNYTLELRAASESNKIVVPVLDDDTVVIEATVLPTLTFELHDEADNAVAFDEAIGFGDLDAINPRYATNTSAGSAVLPAGGAHGFRIGTNAANGYVVTAEGATLTHDNGIDVINAIGGAAVASTSGIEQFGLCLNLDTSATDPTQNGTIATQYDCDTGYTFAAGIVNHIAYGNGGGGTGSGQPTSMTFYDVDYLANISTLTEAGSYSTEITFLATGMF